MQHFKRSGFGPWHVTQLRILACAVTQVSEQLSERQLIYEGLHNNKDRTKSSSEVYAHCRMTKALECKILIGKTCTKSQLRISITLAKSNGSQIPYLLLI